MTGPNYYNEIDPDAAAILRVLIAEGHIAPGDVDERSIEDVRPDELAGYTQCHFFAGIGIWSLALRQAGWPDDRPVWTGSCPCQPFSAAGKGDGFADERHLWPHFYHLISQCRPAEILGEQVAAKAVEPWIDLVHADLEAVGYAFGCVPFPAAGVGAPHIRDRAYWVGHADATRLSVRQCAAVVGARRREEGRTVVQPGGAPRGLADHLMQQRQDGEPGVGAEHAQGGRLQGSTEIAGLCCVDGVADTQMRRHEGQHLRSDGEQTQRVAESGSFGERPGPTNGLWRAADWLLCRDEKWRPVEPGTFPLADAGTFRNRVAALRGAGNAITLGQAQAFIESVMA